MATNLSSKDADGGSGIKLQTPCPDSETLALYVENRLDSGHLARIRSHLLHCETCWEIYAESLRSLAESS